MVQKFVMKRKFWICTVVLLLIFPLAGHGQVRWKILRYEAGVGLGSVHSFTDIGPSENSALNFFNGTRPNLTVDLRYKLGPKSALKIDLGYMLMGGTDVDSDSHFRPGGGWAFRTHAIEHTLRLELYILGERRFRSSTAIYGRKGMINNFKKVNLYLFAGAGGIISKGKVFEAGDPKSELIGLTGYDNNFLWNPVFPGGIGAKYAYSTRISFGAEAGVRYTLTDFLDAYSDPYWGSYDDYYYIVSFKMIYKIRAGRNGLPVFKKSGLHY